MHFVFAVIIKMIMMFSPSISWAPSDKISLAFVESGRGAGQLQEADLIFGPPAVRVQWSLCFSPPVVQIQYHSAAELAILILKHVCDLVYSSVWCVYKHQRERGKKISTMLLGSVNPRLGYFIPISPPPSPPCRKVSGSEWFLSSLWYDLMSLLGWILSVLTRWLHLDGVAGSDVLQK